jgi:hypothetical protein
MALLSEILRSRWFSTCLHAGLWLLFVLAVIGLGGHAPQFQEATVKSAARTLTVPVDKLATLFVPANWPQRKVDAASLNLFTTSYFFPPPATAPASSPPPPPPTTWKVELTYQGFYRTGDGPNYALLRLGEKLFSVPVGGVVVTNLYVAEAALQNLTLTNSAMQTNVLTVNTKREVEVPLK